MLAGRRPSASLQAYFLIPMWSSRCVGEHSGSTLFGGPSARINWRHELARMISRLNKEAVDQGLGIAESRVDNPEALHRGKKRFVGPDAPLKEQLRRSHHGRFPKYSRLSSPASRKQGTNRSAMPLPGSAPIRRPMLRHNAMISFLSGGVWLSSKPDDSRNATTPPGLTTSAMRRTVAPASGWWTSTSRPIAASNGPCCARLSSPPTANVAFRSPPAAARCSESLTDRSS